MSKTLHLPSSVRTGGVALPSRMESQVLREQAQLRQELELISAKMDYFNKELYRIDPHLSVMLAKPKTTVQGLKPGYYHLVRMNPGHAAYIKPIEADDGSWRDLDSSIFDLAAEDDLWNDRVTSDRRRRQKRAMAAQQRQRDRESLDRAAEFDARWKSANNISVSIPRSVTT